MAKRTISTCDMDLKSSSKKFSNIWDNLTKIDDKKVKCNFCFKMLNLDKSGSTGNLLKHLRSHKEYEAKSAIPSTKPIFSFCTSSAKMNPTSMEAANITSSLCEYIIQDLRPLCTVRGERFKMFCQAMNPRYPVPCYQTIRANIEKSMN